MSFLLEKEICPTCNGEKEIECCSCGEEEGHCYMMPCPYCQGAGVIKHYNKPAVIGLLGAVAIAVIAALLLM